MYTRSLLPVEYGEGGAVADLVVDVDALERFGGQMLTDSAQTFRQTGADLTKAVQPQQQAAPKQ